MEFSGSGVVSKRPSHPPIEGLRAAKAAIAMTYQKYLITEIVTTNGAKLACNLSKKYNDIWGQCIKSSNQQTLSIKTLKDGH